MNVYGKWDAIIRDIIRVVNPSREDWEIRFRVMDEIKTVAQSVESLRGVTVEPYGSFASNLFTKWGDLDISIELANGAYITSLGKRHKLSLLEDVQKALRSSGGWRRLRLVSHGRIPILKLESRFCRISCEIAINNLSSQMKSKILFWINEIDPRFRDFVLLVKEWAKAHGINSSKSGSLTSYALCLLVVFHFQTCEPAILPPFKEIYPGNMVHDLEGVRVDAEKHIEQTCAHNIRRIKSDKSRRRNTNSLSDLFVSFLAKYCDVSVRALVQGISPYSGQWEDIDSNMTWQPQTYTLFVEDPLEQPANSARTVNKRHLTKIAEACQTTYETLTSPSVQDSRFILSMLAEPEVCSLVTGTPMITYPPTGNGYHLGNHPQVHRPIHEPTHIQPRPRSTWVHKRQNNAVPQGPVQVNQKSQGQQQIWRPKSAS